MSDAKRFTVAVSGLHRGESPQPGGAVIEGLRARFSDIRIVGISYDAIESGLFSTGTDRTDISYLFPYPHAGEDALLSRLQEVHAIENIDLIIPTLDSEIENLITFLPILKEMGIVAAVPSRESFDMRDKPVLSELGEATGVLVPKTLSAYNPETLAYYATEIGYPCYVKGRLYDAKKVYSEAELYIAYESIFRIWGGPVLLQEDIVGEEYNIAGLGDGKGGLIAYCMIRKLLRTRIGKGFAGVVVDDPALFEKVSNIISELKWNGPFEIEFIKPAGLDHYLFEINPRFPAWIGFPARIGCNIPAALAERMMGLPPSAINICEAGKMFFRHCEDIVGDIADVAELSNTGKLLFPSRSNRNKESS